MSKKINNFSKKDIPNILGIVGSLLLLISIFLPIAKYTFNNSCVSSIFNSSIGSTIFSCIIISLFLICTKRNIYVIFPMIVLLCEIISGYSSISNVAYKVGSGLIIATIGEIFIILDFVFMYFYNKSEFKKFLNL